MVLETLVLPQERYARIRNVWTVPGTDRLLDWIRNAGFKDIELADVTRTTIEEQRSTPWMQFESLAEAPIRPIRKRPWRAILRPYGPC